MITRTLIVIAVILVPYLVGMIKTCEFMDTFSTYLRGVYYICFIVVVSLIFYGIYYYIRYGKW